MSASLGGLIQAYFTHAWGFALLHLLCLLLIAYLLVSLRRERLALESWQPAGASNSVANSITRALDEFVRSVDQLGQLGTSVDATEHLQSIDERRARREMHLSDAVHALLLIGIAGSLFGLFAFAAEASRSVGRPDYMQTVARSLATAMSKAFPVGFVGVILMLGAQGLTASFERRFQNALDGAVSRALKYRRETAVAETQFIATVRDSIRESMAPLQSLGDVLDKSLRPVIASFEYALRQSNANVADQMERLGRHATQIDETNAAFRRAAEEVRLTTQQLSGLSGGLQNHLEAVKKESGAAIRLSDDLLKFSDRQNERLERMAQVFEVDLEHAARLTDRVDEVITASNSLVPLLADVPERMVAATREAVQTMMAAAGQEALAVWSATSTELAYGTTGALAQALNQTITDLRSAVEALDQHTVEWQRVGANVTLIVGEAVAKGVAASLAPVTEQVTEAQRLTEQLIADTSARTAEVFKRTTGVATDLLNQTRTLAAELLKETNGAVAGTARAFSASGPKIAEEVRKATDALAAATSRLTEQLGVLQPALGEVAQSWREAGKTVEPRLVTIADKLDATAASLQAFLLDVRTRVDGIERRLGSTEPSVRSGDHGVQSGGNGRREGDA